MNIIGNRYGKITNLDGTRFAISVFVDDGRIQCSLLVLSGTAFVMTKIGW